MNEAGRRALARLSALILLAAPTRGLACQCPASSSDAAIVARVQSSWASAGVSARAGNYARALRELRSTVVFLPRIHDAGSRKCVAAGADNLIASALAGKSYLARHPGDAAGARAAARRSWRTLLACG